MESTKVLGFIGSGKMGEALIRGILKQKRASAEDIFIHDLSLERCSAMEKLYQVRSLSLQDLLNRCEVIFFAIKPQVFPEIFRVVQQNISIDCLCVSIMAGIPIKNLQCIHQDIKVVRAMPNTAAQLGLGMTALVSSENVRFEELSFVKNIFQSVGKSLIVEEEQMDTITALSGSGPAYVFRFVQAFLKAGSSQDLPLDQVKTLIYQTVQGAGALLEKSSKTCEELIQEVASKGGTTEAGLKAFDDLGLDDMMAEVVRRAKHRSQELGLF